MGRLSRYQCFLQRRLCSEMVCAYVTFGHQAHIQVFLAIGMHGNIETIIKPQITKCASYKMTERLYHAT